MRKRSGKTIKVPFVFYLSFKPGLFSIVCPLPPLSYMCLQVVCAPVLFPRVFRQLCVSRRRLIRVVGTQHISVDLDSEAGRRSAQAGGQRTNEGSQQMC